VFSILILYISSLGIYIFENDAQPEKFGSIFDSLWWSIVTLTTVGYGDAFPVTVGGKIFTSLIVIIGLGIIAVPTGLFASALSKTIKEK
jgi:voltage-gated potassium channel